MTIATTTSCSNHKSCIANVHTHPHREFVSPAIIIYDDAAAGVDVFVSKRLQLMSIGLMVTQLVVSTFFFFFCRFLWLWQSLERVCTVSKQDGILPDCFTHALFYHGEKHSSDFSICARLKTFPTDLVWIAFRTVLKTARLTLQKPCDLFELKGSRFGRRLNKAWQNKTKDLLAQICVDCVENKLSSTA